MFGSAMLAVGSVGMCVALLCLQYILEAASAVLAVGSVGMCVALLCLQYILEAFVWLCCACSRFSRVLCSSAVLQ